MKRIGVGTALLLAFVLCALAFSGCGGDNGDVNKTYDPERADAAMTGDVRVWWGPMDYMKAPLERAIAAFGKKFPFVNVHVEYQLHSDYIDQLNLAYLNGTAPDVIRMDHVLLQSLGESRRVLDLNAVTAGKAERMEKEKFLPASWDGVRIKDAVYGFPFDTNTTLLMYNEAICREVFGDDYAPPATYEELKEDSLAVYNYQREGKKPYKGLVMAIDAKGSQHDVYVLNGWLARYGAAILNEDRTAATLDTPAAVEALERLLELKQAGAVEYIGYAPTLENEFLYAGTTAFIEMGSWVYETIRQLDTDGDGASDVRIAPMPVLKQGVPGYATLGLFGLGVTSQCTQANTPAAYEFIKFLSTDYDAQLDYAKSTNTMPTLVAGQDDPYYGEEGENAQFWQGFKNQLQRSLPRPGTMLWPEVVTELKTMERNLMLGRFPAKEVAADATRKINGIFAELRG